MLNYNIWITKMGNIKQHHCVPKLMTQSQTTDAFTEHVQGLIYQAMVWSGTPFSILRDII